LKYVFDFSTIAYEKLFSSSLFSQPFKLQCVQIHAVPLTLSLGNVFWYYPKTIQKQFS